MSFTWLSDVRQSQGNEQSQKINHKGTKTLRPTRVTVQLGSSIILKLFPLKQRQPSCMVKLARLRVFGSCMFKTPLMHSTTPRRACRTTSAARRHAGTTSGPRPIVSRPATAATKHGPSRSRVASPEQPTELPRPHRRAGRSHSQERAIVTTPNATDCIFAGIDVAKHKLDLALTGIQQVATFTNDTAGFTQLVELLLKAPPKLIVVEATGGLERPLLDALLEANLPVHLA